jgi:hypothetical protein
MARPRIFVSSTYYDLKNVRVALSAFIDSMGYDATLNETGSIAYGKSDPLDVYCYDEIQNCDIIISLIGGRYGSAASDGTSSISQKELKTALDLGKQVYIFVDRNVLAEYITYKNNKSVEVKWAHVDNVAIYRFIEELYNLPNNNAIITFEDSESITLILKEQWSGLFQRLLQERVILGQITVAQELSQGLSTLKQVLDGVTLSNPSQSSNLADLATIQHPAFSRLKRILNIKYRVFFISEQEMEDWLKSRNYFKVEPDRWDDPHTQEWMENKYASAEKPHPLLKIRNSLFDSDGFVLPAAGIDWDDDFIKMVSYDPATNTTLD